MLATVTEPATARRPPFLRRVRIRNYRSIEDCNVELGSLVALVGRNGSGKSNFLDALRFVADGLNTTLDQALRERGGLPSVRRRSTGHPRNFAIVLDVGLGGALRARFGFEIAARHSGGFVVKREEASIEASGIVHAHYRVEDGQITRQADGVRLPAASADRLFLVSVSGLPEFRPLYDALASMGFYNLNPEVMKRLQNPDAGELLHRDGSNIASVIGRMAVDNPPAIGRLREYLRLVVPQIHGFERISLGPQETVEFRQPVAGAEHPWKFYAMSMSDGTLRALGILVAVMQLADRHERVRLVGIEEPETALHPAAAEALVDALREASATTQVLVTTHSPELLDHLDVNDDTLFAVHSDEGRTIVAPFDAASLKTIKDHLYTAGDLLRMDQLAPDLADVERQRQGELFSTEAIH